MNQTTLQSTEAIYIFNTFKVSIEEANSLAAEYRDLIVSKGGDVSSFSTAGFNELVTKQIKDRYEWKNSVEKDKFDQRQKEKTDSYNLIINSKKRPFV